MANKLPPFETWAESWQAYGWNNCFAHAARALDYLAKYDRPIGGEQHYNAIDLEDTANDIRRTLEAMAEYKNRLDILAATDILNEDDNIKP